MALIATSRSWLGIGKEPASAKGTAVDPQTTYGFIPVSPPTVHDEIVQLDDMGLRGSMVDLYNVVQGPKWATFDYSGDVFPESLGFYLQSILNDYNTAATGGTAGTPTILSANTSAGTTTITVASNSGFTAGKYIVIDSASSGTFAEIRTQVGSATGGGPYTVTLDQPLNYAHTSGITVTPYTGNPTSLTHTFSTGNSGTANQPNTYTITDYQGVTATYGARQYPGATLTELTLKFDAAGKITFDAKWIAYPSAAATKNYTTAFQTTTPTAAYAASTVSVGGSNLLSGPSPIQSGDITLKRTVTPIHAADGTAPPYSLFAGPVSVSGNFLYVAEDENQLTNYLNNSQPALDLKWTLGGGSQTIEFLMNNAVYFPADITRSKDYVETQVAYRARANTTNAGASTGGYSAVKATLVTSATVDAF
jgi:Phage tail tube protein